MNFENLNLSLTTLENLKAQNFSTPTEIQSLVLQELGEGTKDIVAKSQTGSGKTLAFLMPLIERLNEDSPRLQAIILTPTRELTGQVYEEFNMIAKGTNLKAVKIYGGVSTKDQINNLKDRKPQLVIGTPGRVKDLFEQNVLKLGKIKIAILDEADEMMDRGFLEDIDYLLAQMKTHHTWLFSATIPTEIRSLITQKLNDPSFLEIETNTQFVETIEQKYILVKDKNKVEALCRLLAAEGEDTYALIFCQTRELVRRVSEQLSIFGFVNEAIHGDLAQPRRTHVLKQFKAKKIRILVATDVAARGLDVDDLTHVVNIGVTQTPETYIHRIGRTGRAGKNGKAISIVSPGEMYVLNRYKKKFKLPLDLMKLPSLREINDALIIRELRNVKKIDSHLNEFEQEKFLVELSELSKEELIEKITSYIKNNSSRYFTTGSELNVEAEPTQKKSRERRSVLGRNFKPRRDAIRLFANVGSANGLSFKQFVRAIETKMDVQGRDIFNVDLKRNFSFFEVPKRLSNKFLNSHEISIGNAKVTFEVSNPRK